MSQGAGVASRQYLHKHAFAVYWGSRTNIQGFYAAPFNIQITKQLPAKAI
jgi:hypothetical protein